MSDVICIACGEANPPWFRACQACDAVLLHTGPIPDPPPPKAPPIPAPSPSSGDNEPADAPTAESVAEDHDEPAATEPSVAAAEDAVEPASEAAPVPEPAATPLAKLSPRERAHRAIKGGAAPSAAPVSSGFGFDTIAPSPSPTESTPAVSTAPAPSPADQETPTPAAAPPPVPIPEPQGTNGSDVSPAGEAFDWSTITTPAPGDGWSVPAPVTPIPTGEDGFTEPASDWPDAPALAPMRAPDGLSAPRHQPARRPEDRPQVSYPEEPSSIRRNLPKLLLGVLVALVALGAIWYFLLRDDATPPAADAGGDGGEAPATTTAVDLASLTTNAEPSIAFIDSSGCDVDRSGSGFFIDEQLVVTSATLVAGDTDPEIVTIDGSVTDAEVIAIDVDDNLALLRIEDRRFAPLEVAAAGLDDGAELVVIEDTSAQPGVRAGLTIFAGYLDADSDTPTFVLAPEEAPEGDGAVVLNASGRVVGVVGAIERAGSPVNVVTSPDAIAAFVDDNASRAAAVDPPCIAPTPSEDWSSARFGSDDRSVGDDVVLDHLYDECSAGELAACDDLAIVAPDDSSYQQFGLSCGDTEEPSVLACTATIDGAQDVPRIEWTPGDCAFLPRGSRLLLRAADCEAVHDAQVIAFDVIDDDVEADVDGYCAEQLPDGIEEAPVWAEAFDIGGLVPTAGSTTPRAICFLYIPGEAFSAPMLGLG